MKKLLTLALVALMTTTHASAQSEGSDWTLNTRAWSTNYFTTAIYLGAELLVKEFVGSEDKQVEQVLDQILCDPNLVFPIGIEKNGFTDANDIRTPYYYAFGSPFKHMGDWGVGIDASWKSGFLGLYAGAYYKSQEIVMKATDDNLRGYYFQPRAGLLIGGKNDYLEAGVFYDKVVRCGGSIARPNTNMLKEGWGIDVGFSTTDKKDRSKFIVQFSMPLHNFLNEDHAQFYGKKRRVGYIMLTQRFNL